MSTSSSNNSNTSDKNDDVVIVGNPTVRVSSPSSPSSSSSPPDPDSKNANETNNETSPGGTTSAFALYRDRAGSDSQHQNQAQSTSPSGTSGSAFSSIAAGTAFSLSPSLIADGSAAGFLTSTAAAISANNGICAPSQLTSTVSSLFGAPTSISPSPVATAVANAINATSNTLITSTPFVFGKGLFDRVTNGDKDQESTSTSTNGTSSETTGSSDGGGFVFGQNLSDRVINQQTSEEQAKEGNDNNGQAEAPAPAPTLFQNAIDQQQPEVTLEPEVFGAAGNPALAQLNNSDIVVSTGEEDERNVLQMNCKLYIFDKDSSSWIERGQGQLRLNDPVQGTPGKSRIIIRTAGTRRVLLNTQIWEGIDLKIPSEKKCLRLVGRDELNDHKLHVFMVKCPSQDAVTNLHRSIRTRLEALKQATKEKQEKLEEAKSTTKRINPESDDSAPDSPAATSLPPSTKKAHLD